MERNSIQSFEPQWPVMLDIKIDRYTFNGIRSLASIFTKLLLTDPLTYRNVCERQRVSRAESSCRINYNTFQFYNYQLPCDNLDIKIIGRMCRVQYIIFYCKNISMTKRK